MIGKLEEDIKTLENFINWLKTNFEYDSGNEIKAIEHILSAYQEISKENKELNKKLILQKGGSNYWCEKYAELQNKNIKLKADNEKLYEEYLYYKELASKYQGVCIPKRIVRDKIEKIKPIIEKYNKQMENDEETDLSYEEVREYVCKYEALQDLLE